ncbi:MAG TPA: M48 family metalloprotease [Phycisphaeraceae bacterium]
MPRPTRRRKGLIGHPLKHRLFNAWDSLMLTLALWAWLGAAGYLMAHQVGLAAGLAAGVAGVVIGPLVAPAMARLWAKPRPLLWPSLGQTLNDLAQQAGVDPPRLVVQRSHRPAIFTLGPSSAARIILSEGLLRIMNSAELAGMLAHELAHLRHRDLRLFALADGVSLWAKAASVVGVALAGVNAGLLIVVDRLALPWDGVATLALTSAAMGHLQRFLSRRREFDADREAVRLTNQACELIHALRKLELTQRGGAVSILLGGPGEPVPSTLRVHPSAEQRIRRLRAIAPVQLPPAEHQRVKTPSPQPESDPDMPAAAPQQAGA